MIGSVVMCGDEPVSAGGVRIGSTIAYIGVISAICRAWVRVSGRFVMRTSVACAPRGSRRFHPLEPRRQAGRGRWAGEGPHVVTNACFLCAGSPVKISGVEEDVSPGFRSTDGCRNSVRQLADVGAAITKPSASAHGREACLPI